ncbi:uncharacterized protein A4U43_C08F13620 [Asparagus officinalis]|nr:uncharacterized protein A4U43_C08F13620 [Asparagus officinalis]
MGRRAVADQQCGSNVSLWYLPILKACVLIQGKEATAITVALPASLGMAAIEALFQYRIARPYLNLGRFSMPAFGEAFLIAYLYSLLIVLDTIISCILYQSLKNGDRWTLEDGDDLSLGLKKEQKGYLEV